MWDSTRVNAEDLQEGGESMWGSSPRSVPGDVTLGVQRVACSSQQNRGESQVHRTRSRTESSGTEHRGAAERFIPENCPDEP